MDNEEIPPVSYQMVHGSVQWIDSSNKYGITRGAAYWKKGGAGK